MKGVFAFPAGYPNEGQTITILEAMGNGMLVITTDHSGIPDIVKDGVNGIVASKDMENREIYLRLRELTNQDILKIAGGNVESCREKYMEKKHISQTEQMFTKILRREAGEDKILHGYKEVIWEFSIGCFHAGETVAA